MFLPGRWPACAQGAENYNNSDGSSYVIINDALPKTTSKALAYKAQADRLSGVRGAKPLPKQANVKELEVLFARAAKENWGYKKWVKASKSKADASKWRRLLTWPFGDEGGVFKFNKDGDALYIITSVGR